MNRIPSFALTIVFFSLAFGALSPALHGEEAVDPKADLQAKIEWPGALGHARSHWTDQEPSGAEFWLTRRADGFLVLNGRDGASSYEAIVRLGGENVLHFEGSGFNFVDGRTFLYRSTVAVRVENGVTTLAEKWTATYADGHEVTGDAIFTDGSSAR